MYVFAEVKGNVSAYACAISRFHYQFRILVSWLLLYNKLAQDISISQVWTDMDNLRYSYGHICPDEIHHSPNALWNDLWNDEMIYGIIWMIIKKRNRNDRIL